MANNRMFLVNDEAGVAVYLGKYYPSTGWYSDNPDLGAELNKALDDDPSVPVPLGSRAWRIAYESDEDFDYPKYRWKRRA